MILAWTAMSKVTLGISGPIDNGRPSIREIVRGTILLLFRVFSGATLREAR